MNPKLKRSLIITGIAITFAILVRYIFDIKSLESLFSIMSVSFILLVPFGIGALTIHLSEIENVKLKSYRIFMPWVPIFGFLILTLVLSIEGWACWLMILPVFLLAASLGGLTAGYFKLKKASKEKTYISLLVLLPFILSPVEQFIGNQAKTYKAYTFIDIHADKTEIWKNVTRVKAIPKEQDKGWLTNTLTFPRPIRAELNYEGVGAYRQAIFEKGLIFHEQVTAYRHQRKMSFSITANPYEIPSTTMDKHVVIGGDYFNVLDGTYVLQKLDTNTYRLHLYSHYKLTTTFNFYASLWAGWIMKDIQNNILQVIKDRAQHDID